MFFISADRELDRTFRRMYLLIGCNVLFFSDDTDFIRNLKSRYKRAFVNWKRAAAQGFGGARLKLGDYYYYGQGLPDLLFFMSYCYNFKYLAST